MCGKIISEIIVHDQTLATYTLVLKDKTYKMIIYKILIAIDEIMSFVRNTHFSNMNKYLQSSALFSDGRVDQLRTVEYKQKQTPKGHQN